MAVTFRQTNIIWSLFIVGTALLELSTPAERRRFDPKAAFVQSPQQLVQALTGFIQMLLSKLTMVIRISRLYLGLLAGFAAFVKLNGGIVLGRNTILLVWWSWFISSGVIIDACFTSYASLTQAIARIMCPHCMWCSCSTLQRFRQECHCLQSWV